MKLLLHACCGPCSLEPVRLLQKEGHELTLFYANSNIAPVHEYTRRLDTLHAWAQDAKVPVIEGTYDPDVWEKTAGRIGEEVYTTYGLVADEHAAAFAQLRRESAGMTEGADASAGADEVSSASATAAASTSTTAIASASATAAASTTTNTDIAVGNLSPEARSARAQRCRACYRMRLAQAAHYAAKHGFDALGTTLTVSPYQYTDIIAEELARVCDEAGLTCAFRDYRPYYDEATRKSRELGMYRQNYCGCRFSAAEAAAEQDARKAARAAARAQKEASQAKKHAQEAAARSARKAERAAYDAKQARKHAILKALREKK